MLITVIDGVALGVLLFCIALGLSLVFGVMDVLNLAHGVLYLGGAETTFGVSERFAPCPGAHQVYATVPS